MNLNDPRHPWARLTAAARRAPDNPENRAPYGFATRVAALALGREEKTFSMFERFALRAVGLSALLALASVAVNYPALRATLSGVSAPEEELVPADDALAAVLDFSD